MAGRPLWLKVQASPLLQRPWCQKEQGGFSVMLKRRSRAGSSACVHGPREGGVKEGQ